MRSNEYGEHIISSVRHPSITPFLPGREKSTGAAVIIVPGGGHSELWMDHEGYNVAKWLSDHGVGTFMLKYRLAREKGSTYTIEGSALADVKRAIRLVRSRASEWALDPRRVGVMGFSAGGELAALASTRYHTGFAGAIVYRVSEYVPGQMYAVGIGGGKPVAIAKPWILPRRGTPGLQVRSIPRRPPNLQSDRRRQTVTRKTGDEAQRTLTVLKGKSYLL
jgi:hypothetical protein